jgi:hypothetical protein
MWLNLRRLVRWWVSYTLREERDIGWLREPPMSVAALDDQFALDHADVDLVSRYRILRARVAPRQFQAAPGGKKYPIKAHTQPRDRTCPEQGDICVSTKSEPRAGAKVNQL